jgi:hypothetical protein
VLNAVKKWTMPIKDWWAVLPIKTTIACGPPARVEQKNYATARMKGWGVKRPKEVYKKSLRMWKSEEEEYGGKVKVRMVNDRGIRLPDIMWV